MIRENVSLAEYTTFKIGGPARCFLTVKDEKEIEEAVEFSRKKNLPYFILGGGSNLLINDRGYEGAVIQMKNRKIELKGKTIFAEAGVELSDLVSFSVQNSLAGLEWAAGIPGTVGGAVRGNAGAFGHSFAEAVGKVKTTQSVLSNKDCQFDYRGSVFKRNNNIIISTEINLEKGDKSESQALINGYLNQRKEKHPLNYPSAGCVFKNPKPLVAGKLIEECGLKGKQIGRARISEKQANFIVNLGGAKAADVQELIRLIKKSVKRKFNLELEEELRYL